ncbi:MAG TPA: cyclic beta 1-2 glucan synthetase, partial [Usitatibacter sp.]|nr:cyclic beta 1-2 glucan synthetase [Usitatibacter sp.]
TARDPRSLILVIADMARSNPPMASPFVAELARRLQGHSAALALPLTWIEAWLSESGLSIEQLVQHEAQEQAGVQVSIGNTIGSLRFLAATDWRDFFESASGVEKKLREDPGGLYGRMDFATRDSYRHAVEEIARRGVLSESEVARIAVRMAHDGMSGTAGRTGDDDRRAHVGFYLVDEGRVSLERAAKMRPGLAHVAARIGRKRPMLLYGGAILLGTAALAGAAWNRAYLEGVSGPVLVALAFLLPVAASQLVVGVVNWLATLLATPHLLPRMDFSRGIPPPSRTLVAVPTMLADREGVDALIEALEVRFLGNRDVNLHLALLTDLEDAGEETLPEDAALVALAASGIEDLNARYPREDGDTFFLFHRARRWNASQGAWMGRERKRGKLADLNAFLRGASDRFDLVVGDVAALPGVKYVITLDTDTQ